LEFEIWSLMFISLEFVICDLVLDIRSLFFI